MKIFYKWWRHTTPNQCISRDQKFLYFMNLFKCFVQALYIVEVLLRMHTCLLPCIHGLFYTKNTFISLVIIYKQLISTLPKYFSKKGNKKNVRYLCTLKSSMLARHVVSQVIIESTNGEWLSGLFFIIIPHSETSGT